MGSVRHTVGTQIKDSALSFSLLSLSFPGEGPDHESGSVLTPTRVLCLILVQSLALGLSLPICEKSFWVKWSLTVHGHICSSLLPTSIPSFPLYFQLTSYYIHYYCNRTLGTLKGQLVGKEYQSSSSPGLIPGLQGLRSKVKGGGGEKQGQARSPGPASPPPTLGTEATCLSISLQALSLAKGKMRWGGERALKSRGDSLLPANGLVYH